MTSTGPISILQFVMERGLKGYALRMHCPIRLTWIWLYLETHHKPTALKRAQVAKAQMLQEAAALAVLQANSFQKQADALYKLAEKTINEAGVQHGTQDRKKSRRQKPTHAKRGPDDGAHRQG